MKFVFYVSVTKSREAPLRQAWERGVTNTGDEILIRRNDETPIAGDDVVAIMVGLKSLTLRDACRAVGNRVITFDKGYDRKHDWWRSSIDEHQPTHYLDKLDRTPARMKAAGWEFKPWRGTDKTGAIVSDPSRHIIIAGGGRKYYDAHDLPDPVDYIGGIVAHIRAAGCTRKIIYRPKPSMADVMPVADTVLSRHKSIYEVLENAHALVTFGSNACFEALLAGIPSIVLGDAIARSISSHSVDDIEHPKMVGDEERRRLLTSLAYCQFRESEIVSGFAINELKAQLREVVPALPCEEHQAVLG